MPAFTAKIFRNGRNQAVRIPAALRFDTDTVTIEKHGDGLLLRPRQAGGWDRFFDDPALVLPDDFDTGEDPPAPEREAL